MRELPRGSDVWIFGWFPRKELSKVLVGGGACGGLVGEKKSARKACMIFVGTVCSFVGLNHPFTRSSL